MAIIAISGRKSSGKNLVASIIQYLTCDKGLNLCTYQEWMNYNSGQTSTPWQQKQFANKIKDIICLLIGCTKEDLENEDFKSKELPEQWWVWKLEREGGYSTILLSYLTTTKKELANYSGLKLFKPTVRSLLQEVGTDLFRNLIHPDIWITSLFNEYKPIGVEQSLSDTIIESLSNRKDDKYLIAAYKSMYPAWIITDLRFKNELKAVKDRNGISIRVNRKKYASDKFTIKDGLQSFRFVEMDFNKPHISETELDNETFDYVIDNNSDIEELIEKVKQILILEKLL